MKKAFTRWIGAALFIVTIGWPAAADIVIVYPSADAVLKGQNSFATITADGVLLSAQDAVAANTKPLLGLVGEKLHFGVLVKLDNQLNAALFSLGDEVPNQDLQKAHEKKSTEVKAFLPAAQAQGPSPSSYHIAASTQPFVIKINGKSIDEGPVVLPVVHGRSDMKLEVIRNDVEPVWKIVVRLQSDPNLLFWTKGKRQTLNDVPTKKFRLDHQLLFAPMSLGGSVPMSIEISSIKSETCVWTLQVESKKGTVNTTIPVTFQGKNKT